MTLTEYLNQLNVDQKRIHDHLKSLIVRVYPDIQETLFAKQPYFYLTKHENIKFHHRPSIMLSFFGDHVNVFSLANQAYREDLPDYGFTDKNTMQIKLSQDLNEEVLSRLFRDALKS